MLIFKKTSTLAVRHVLLDGPVVGSAAEVVVRDGVASLVGAATGAVGRVAEETVAKLAGEWVKRAAERLRSHLTDHGQAITGALAEANERAWKSIEVALAGNRWRDNLFASETDKGLRVQMQAFLETAALPAGNPVFLGACLAELRTARKRGHLGPDDSFRATTLAEELGPFARYDDPDAILDAECAAVADVGGELRRLGYPNLGRLLQETPTRGQPLLAMAAQFYFRRRVVEDERLSRELVWVKQIAIERRVQDGFVFVILLLGRQGQQLEALLAGQEEVRAVAVETRDNVLELHAEVREATREVRLLRRDLTAGQSASYRDEHERAMIRALKGRYRALSDEQRRRFPQIGLDMARLEVVAGDFLDALGTARDVAGVLDDRKVQAEAHHAAFRAALELRRWDEALTELQAAVAADPRYALWPVNRHRIEAIPGAGAFGVALLAWDPYLQRRVVLKSFEADGIDRDVATIFREAQVLNSLRHPGIIELYHCGFVDDARQERPYLEIEHFADSLSLEEHIRRHGALGVDDLLPIARQIARALHAAHARDVLHRDVKPGNLLVRQSAGGWEVKVIDFGLALRRSLVRAETARSAARGKSMIGSAVAGTMQYAAPEQLEPERSSEVGPHSDVYGFGRTCYFALTGEPEPDDADKEELPAPWRSLLGGCTARKIDRRPRDFAAVLERLKTIQEPSQKAATPPPIAPPTSAPGGTLPTHAAFRPATPPETADRPLALEKKLTAACHGVAAPVTGWEGSKAGDLEVVRVKDQEVRFRWCPPGSFKMGSPTTEEGRYLNEDQVDVTLTHGFWMQETPITQGLWQTVTGDHIEYFIGLFLNPKIPICDVTHGDAEEFAAILTSQLREDNQLPLDLRLTLPTEAQWEYAARAGTTTRFPFGEDESKLDEYIWYSGNSGDELHEVKARQPNPWGLHDMLGNVSEWCADGYAKRLRGGVNPRGPSKASCRVIRGGSAFDLPRNCRPAFRDRCGPESPFFVGFRLATA